MSVRFFVAGLLLSAITSVHAEEKVFSGSGYAAAEGAVVNYTYNNFGGFYLTVENHTIRWEGFHGYFHGLSSANSPQISEVAPDVFLFSWRTRGNGSDNVVLNYNTMRVSAHLQPNDGAGEAIQMIHGVVHCKSTPECIRPREELTPKDQFGPSMANTIKEFGLPPLHDAAVNNVARAAADIAARSELKGSIIAYDTPEGRYEVKVDGNQTRVKIGNGEPATYQTYASKVADDLYFISWMGGVGGSHIVVNKATRTVYDHILPSGERRESIFKLICFGSPEDC